jgi:hypothetical protein
MNNAFATLYIDGQAVSTQTLRNSPVKFSGFSKVVGTTASRFDVRVSFTEDFATNDTFSLRLTSLDAIDTVSSTDIGATLTSASFPTSAQFVFKAAEGTLLVSDNNPKSSLFLA